MAVILVREVTAEGVGGALKRKKILLSTEMSVGDDPFFHEVRR